MNKMGGKGGGSTPLTPPPPPIHHGKYHVPSATIYTIIRENSGLIRSIKVSEFK